MAALLPCPSCARHARVSEPTCPFCATPFDDAFRTDEPRPRAPTGRLTRAALFAVGAGGLVAGTLSCASAESAYGGTPGGTLLGRRVAAACRRSDGRARGGRGRRHPRSLDRRRCGRRRRWRGCAYRSVRSGELLRAVRRTGGWPLAGGCLVVVPGSFLREAPMTHARCTRRSLTGRARTTSRTPAARHSPRRTTPPGATA
jgi:hypothetical protein